MARMSQLKNATKVQVKLIPKTSCSQSLKQLKTIPSSRFPAHQKLSRLYWGKITFSNQIFLQSNSTLLHPMPILIHYLTSIIVLLMPIATKARIYHHYQGTLCQHQMMTDNLLLKIIKTY